MKPTDAERDPAFGRLIARGLEGETDVSGRACPDADLLAAWFDRSLSKSEAERIETHAAGCGSCQQILADLARSEPEVIRAAPVPAPRRPWHWHWRWLVPVTTAAIVIVAIGSRTLRAPQPLTISSRESVAESVSPAPAAADTAAQLPPVAPAGAPAEAAGKDDATLTRPAGTPESKGRLADAAAPAGGGVGGRLQTTADRSTAPAAAPAQAPQVQLQARADETLGFGASKQAVPKPAEAPMRAEENIAVAAQARVAPAPAAAGTATPVKSVAMKLESRLPRESFPRVQPERQRLVADRGRRPDSSNPWTAACRGRRRPAA